MLYTHVAVIRFDVICAGLATRRTMRVPYDVNDLDFDAVAVAWRAVQDLVTEDLDAEHGLSGSWTVVNSAVRRYIVTDAKGAVVPALQTDVVRGI